MHLKIKVKTYQILQIGSLPTVYIITAIKNQINSGGGDVISKYTKIGQLPFLFRYIFFLRKFKGSRS